MKVTIENKKGLEKDLKVFIDKKTISGFMDCLLYTSDAADE